MEIACERICVMGVANGRKVCKQGMAVGGAHLLRGRETRHVLLKITEQLQLLLREVERRLGRSGLLGLNGLRLEALVRTTRRGIRGRRSLRRPLTSTLLGPGRLVSAGLLLLLLPGRHLGRDRKVPRLFDRQ